MSKKIAVAMSGGVDSSVAALLLKQQGYDVIGITGIMHPEGYKDAENAEKICKALNIPHYKLNLQNEFNDKVIKYFDNSYKEGLTPNPCTVCNIKIKWGSIKQFAEKELNTHLYATGHYANIENKNGIYSLKRAKDDKKDQLYMLFGLTQKELSSTIFPLSDYTKAEVREIAIKNNLPCAQASESQDICFIKPTNTTQNYLTEKLGTKKGKIVHIETNEILGEHNGFYHFTIGQRKGIGVSAPKPFYVSKIDAINNIVYVGYKENSYSNKLKVVNINWQQKQNEEDFISLVKIRYNSSAKEVNVKIISEAEALLNFKEPVFSITPGQAAVFYDLKNEKLLGGGWIANEESQIINKSKHERIKL